jgi:DNA polymerase-3 subunit alpha
LADERAVEADLIALADAEGLPLVATNEPFFAKADDYEAHDALLAIAEGALVSNENRRRLSPAHGFKTRAEMTELFKDLPDALANSVEIAMRCAYRVATRKPILPSFGTDASVHLDEAEELRRQAEEGLEARLKAHGRRRASPSRTIATGSSTRSRSSPG